MSLSKEDYFKDESYLHSSQIKTYLDSKELYKLRYIDKNPDYQFEKSDAVIKGTIVDEILTEGKTKYAPKVLKNEDPELFERQKANPEFVATPAVWRDAMLIVEQLPKHPIWNLLKERGDFQKIVEGEIGGVKMCGKLDSLVLDAGIFDLKVTNQMAGKNEHKWKWHCLDLSYHIPSFVYTFLEGNNLPFYHIAVWLENKILEVKLYRVPQSMIEQGAKDTLRAVEGIKNGDFEPELCSLDSAVEIPWLSGEVDVNEEEDEF